MKLTWSYAIVIGFKGRRVRQIGQRQMEVDDHMLSVEDSRLLVGAARLVACNRQGCGWSACWSTIGCQGHRLEMAKARMLHSTRASSTTGKKVDRISAWSGSTKLWKFSQAPILEQTSSFLTSCSRFSMKIKTG